MVVYRFYRYPKAPKPGLQPPGKKLEFVDISGMILEGFGKVLEVLLDDVWGHVGDMFGRCLRILISTTFFNLNLGLNVHRRPGSQKVL